MSKRLIYEEDAIDAVANGLKGVFVEYQDVAEKLLNNVPSVQPEHTVTHSCDSERTETHDLVSRRAALEAMDTWDKFGCDPDGKLVRYDDDKHYVPYVRYEDMVYAVKNLPSAQPEIIRCKDCMHNGSFDTDCPIDWNGKEYCSFAERKEDE